jgi:hypothetical protein
MRCALLAASILLVAAPAYASGDEGGGLMTKAAA